MDTLCDRISWMILNLKELINHQLQFQFTIFGWSNKLLNKKKKTWNWLNAVHAEILEFPNQMTSMNEPSCQ